MAAPVTSAATFAAGGPDVMYRSGIEAGMWQIVVTNSNDAAVAAGVLLNPATYSSDAKASSHVPIIVGGVGTKVRLAARYNNDATWFSATNAQVRVFGADKVPNSSGVFPTSTIFWRLDGATFTTASTAIPVSLANDQTAGSLRYGTPTSNAGYDLLGAKAVLVLTATNGSNDGAFEIHVAAQVL